jgi:hypothetical protein
VIRFEITAAAAIAKLSEVTHLFNDLSTWAVALAARLLRRHVVLCPGTCR